MQVANYISDGFTRPGYIAPVKDFCEGLRFSFRPALVDQRNFISVVNREDLIEQTIRTRKILSTCITTWDLKDTSGKAVTVGMEALKNIMPYLYDRLANIVLGYTASDHDPDWDKSTDDKTVEESYESFMGKTTVGEVREAADEKN